MGKKNLKKNEFWNRVFLLRYRTSSVLFVWSQWNYGNRNVGDNLNALFLIFKFNLFVY